VVLLSGAIAAVAAASLLALPVEIIGPVVLVLTIAALAHRRLSQWQSLLIALVLVILFIPIRRYTMPVNLPFQLEPYRIVVLLITVGWLASLLVDSRTRARKTGLEAPTLLLLSAVVGSVGLNAGRISAAGNLAEATKALMFFLSYFVVIYVIVSVVRDSAQVEEILKVLVAGGALVALAALYESRAGYNIFDHIPLLRLTGVTEITVRGARARAFGSAEHPIAMGAAFVLLLPFAIHFARRSRRWWIAVVLLMLGTMATQSRTAIVMLLAIGIVYLRLRPAQTFRKWPALFPLLAVIHFALPATLGPIKDSFFPKGGLIANQSTSKGTVGQGRVADIGPGLRQWAATPLLGQGFAGHSVDKAHVTDTLAILDDQWLGTLLDTGALGFAGLAWLFTRYVRRCAREGKRDDSEEGWLLVAFAASASAFAFGMLTFDAFGFIQVTLLTFILMSLGCVLLRNRSEADTPRATVPRPQRGVGATAPSAY